MIPYTHPLPTRVLLSPACASIDASVQGEVYRARDTKLGREVAVKVLPDEFARDEQRLARFLREAKVLASLNHPNIAAIHGFEEVDDIHFLVLELVEGETLAERIARGPIPLDEAIAIASKIAGALEEAHENGIVHRDLKPANVKLTPDDKVKVLDFGLAKAWVDETPEVDGSQSPTLTRDATEAGVILGTAAYMSPEQAKGKRVDKRTDIFALGAVLFEMLSGKKAFSGVDVSEVLAAVLRLEPDWKALPRTVPQFVRTLLDRCLRKDARSRIRDMGDVRIALEEGPSENIHESRGSDKALWLAAAGAMALAAFLSFAFYGSRTSPGREGVMRFELLRPGVLREHNGSAVAISPDGRRVAYVLAAADAGATPAVGTDVPHRRGGILLQDLAENEGIHVDGSRGALQPFFSPDGEWLAFFADQKLKKVHVTGGAATVLCDAAQSYGGTWAGKDSIIFAPGDLAGLGLLRVSADGGVPQAVTTLGDGEHHRWPRLMPSGDLMFTVLHEGFRADVRVLSSSGETKVVQEGASDGRYLSSGHLLFWREGAYFAAPFDLAELEVTGPAVPVVEDAQVASLVTYTAAHLDVSANGSLIYLRGGTDVYDLVSVSRTGERESLVSESDRYLQPRFSPDGERLALLKPSTTLAAEDVWVYDLRLGAMTRFTVDPEYEITPAWSPDGRHIAFASRRDNFLFNLYQKQTDGSDAVDRLTDEPSRHHLGEFSPDGAHLAFNRFNPNTNTGFDVYVLDMNERRSSPIRNTAFDESDPTFSSDGRFVAFMSNESGRFEVYVQPFPGSGAKRQISTDGGWFPVFGPGREIFYQATTSEGETRFMVVDYRIDGGELRPSRPRELFRGPYPMGPRTEYDVSPDGERVVAPLREDVGPHPVTLVLNWFEELERLVPAER